MINKKEKKTALRKENLIFFNRHLHFWQYKEKRNGIYIYKCTKCNAQLWYKPSDKYGRE